MMDIPVEERRPVAEVRDCYRGGLGRVYCYLPGTAAGWVVSPGVPGSLVAQEWAVLLTDFRYLEQAAAETAGPICRNRLRDLGECG